MYYLSLCSLFILLNGCTLLYKGTGDTMIAYAEEQGVPYLLATDDVALTCSMVESFSPFLLSFSGVTTPPDQLAVLLYLMAGNCTEFKAWEEELRYLRAVYRKDPIEAQDARIAQQRYLSQAAQRQLRAYQHLALVYAELGSECPAFNTEQEELYWLMGLISGLQALMNEIASAGVTTHVPLNISAKIERAAACLDNKKWWGVPKAIQAALWITIPNDKHLSSEALKQLNDSLQLGLQQGIAITQVIATQVYLGLGHVEKVKQIMSELGNSNVAKTNDRTFRLLNQVSMLQIQHFSDRLWTEATGSRTPIGKIGSFWDDSDSEIDSIDIEDVL
jgi:hypothetical protein